ncbi:FAD/NAD(P)-binding protein [Paracoccus caeni]|uniref:FAD/NAD(P)-binding protein n=1 Tax=Paracoccus caeni TaxID=657651 RepID=A0A934VU33_9RHOB|nr:FAD/NAD(P)-binding protein [Paracoccus caeni]MBK4215386.1 FAD/NAD(P)-binding protein [Paracoccus caeni]
MNIKNEPTIFDAAPATRPSRHVIVIGGGASGVLMASHLLRQEGADLRVTIVEGRHMLGCGVAYSTTDPNHLLNTRASNMSAFPDLPDDFLKWLASRRDIANRGAEAFVSRGVYGAYMSDLLEKWSAGQAPTRLRCVSALCQRLDETDTGIRATLDDGREIEADLAIIATGHALPDPDPEGLIVRGWEAASPIPAEGRVVIIGSGLSMVDQVVSLLNEGHRGQIVALSRRSQLPRIHAEGAALNFAPEELPLGQPVSALMAWLRDRARRAEGDGGTWRDAVDGLRPHLRAIWRALPNPERARFLRHAASWWEVHRHRLPPESAEQINAALASGQLRLVSGAFLRAERDASGGMQAVLRPRGAASEQALPAERIVDCRGIRRDPAEHATPLIAGLLSSGQARIDPLRLGLDIAANCALIDAKGKASNRIFAIGPVSRAAFWEITAIPDIREQTAALAKMLTATTWRHEAARG